MQVGHVNENIERGRFNSHIETDQTSSKESRRHAEDILGRPKQRITLQLFSGASYGFGTRGGPEVENSRMLYSFLEIFMLMGCRFITGSESAQGIIEWFLRF